MKRLSVLAAIGCTVIYAQGSGRGQRQALTLQQAEEIALRNRPVVSAARFNALAAAQVPAEYGAARYPAVTGNFTGAGAPDNTRLAAGAINNPVIYSRLAGGVSISQLLFDFGRTSHLVEGARIQTHAAEENVKASRSQVILEVDRAFLNLLRAEAVMRVARETVASRQLVADQVNELAKARLKSGLDVTFANVALQEAKLLLSSADNERQAASANLTAALGYEDAPQFDLIDEPFRVAPLSRDELISKALRERPDLQALFLEAQSAERFVKAENALRYPAISAVASAGLIPQAASALRGNYSAVGLNVSLPFLNGGLYRARREEADFKARAARERAKELQTVIVREISVALLNVNTAAQRVELTARLLEQASQALDLAQSRYELGLSSIVELSQAQLARTSAAIHQANAKFEYQIQRSVLNFAAGIKY